MLNGVTVDIVCKKETIEGGQKRNPQTGPHKNKVWLPIITIANLWHPQQS